MKYHQPVAKKNIIQICYRILDYNFVQKPAVSLESIKKKKKIVNSWEADLMNPDLPWLPLF